MSTVQYPTEIVMAKDKLKNFELAKEYEKLKYVAEFHDGVWSINKYLLSNPNSPLLEKITNIKRAYTRILLRYIQRITLNPISIDVDSFGFLTMLIIMDLEEEVKYIVENYPELSNVEHNFYQTYSHVFEHLITGLKRIQKQTNTLTTNN